MRNRARQSAIARVALPRKKIRNTSTSGGAISNATTLTASTKLNCHRRKTKVAATHSSIVANKRLRDQRQNSPNPGTTGHRYTSVVTATPFGDSGSPGNFSAIQM